MENTNRQKILVLDQGQSSLAKVHGMLEFGRGRLEIELVTIDGGLPPVIDNGLEYLPDPAGYDLVLDYLRHPDLSLDLALLCADLGIPLVATGKKLQGRGVYTPPTCCGLAQKAGLGEYGQRFGRPELAVEVRDGVVAEVRVIRGAPCGSTWEAAAQMVGLAVTEAPVRFGLETQYCCSADPAGWDPIYQHSPVHFAAEVHRAALARAIAGSGQGNPETNLT